MRYTPLSPKTKYLGFSSKCIVLCDALILVLRGWGMFLNQSSGYRNYIQLSNNLWKHVTQDFNNNVRDEIKDVDNKVFHELPPSCF